MKPMLYFDHAANTPVHPKAMEVFQYVSTNYIANPNASHALGKQANELLKQTTGNIASILGVLPSEIIYTSGATESNNLAITGSAKANRQYGKHCITSYLEHSSILGAMLALQEEGFEVDFVDVKADGTIDMEHFQELLRKDTILVSIAMIDSEVGIIQDIHTIHEKTKALPHCCFHTDATQAVGKFQVDASDYDAMTFTPHKFHGLNGFGVLICKEQIALRPMILGGIATTPYRSGTPNLAMICALEVALQSIVPYQAEYEQPVRDLRNMLVKAMSVYKDIRVNSSFMASPYIINISIKGIRSEIIQEQLGLHNIFVSTKSACCAINAPSKPVYAITKDRKLALSTLRISFAHTTTKEEVTQLLSTFDLVYRQLGGK